MYYKKLNNFLFQKNYDSDIIIKLEQFFKQEKNIHHVDGTFLNINRTEKEIGAFLVFNIGAFDNKVLQYDTQVFRDYLTNSCNLKHDEIVELKSGACVKGLHIAKSAKIITTIIQNDNFDYTQLALEILARSKKVEEFWNNVLKQQENRQRETINESTFSLTEAEAIRILDSGITIKILEIPYAFGLKPTLSQNVYYIVIEFDCTPFKTGIGEDDIDKVHQIWELTKEEINNRDNETKRCFIFKFYGYENLNTTKYDGMKLKIPSTTFVEFLRFMSDRNHDYINPIKLRVTKGLEEYHDFTW